MYRCVYGHARVSRSPAHSAEPQGQRPIGRVVSGYVDCATGNKGDEEMTDFDVRMLIIVCGQAYSLVALAVLFLREMNMRELTTYGDACKAFLWPLLFIWWFGCLGARAVRKLAGHRA